MKKVIGYYNEYEYRVEVDEQEVYQAGNSPHDSQVYSRDLANFETLPLETMRKYCEQTSKEIAKEQGAKYIGVDYLEDDA